MRNKNISKNNQGFTLIELLIVIAIVAILATVGFVALNPTFLTSRANDTKRLAELKNVTDSIARDVAQGNITLGAVTVSDATDTNRVVDGTGWVKFTVVGGSALNFKLGGMNILPVDPKTGTTVSFTPVGSTVQVTKALKYRFCSTANGGYEINAVLENDLQAMAKDGGNEASLYEVGTDLNACGTQDW